MRSKYKFEAGQQVIRMRGGNDILLGMYINQTYIVHSCDWDSVRLVDIPGEWDPNNFDLVLDEVVNEYPVF